MFDTLGKNNVTLVVIDTKKELQDNSSNNISEKISYEIILECVNNALKSKTKKK